MSMPSGQRRPSILISRQLPEAAVRLARSRADVDAYAHDQPMPRAELLDRLADKDGLVCVISETIDEALLAARPGLRVVSNVAVGYNNVDVAACTRRGVVVTNTPDVLTETTADFAWTLLMATARRLAEADRYTREGRFRQWEYMLLLGGDVHGKTLGVVGFGRIGRAMARRALGFGMRVLYQDAVAAAAAAERELRATRTDLATLLRESDFVTLHTPLIPETRHLINAESLRTMKKTAYLINAARGPVVDEAALVRALREGWIAGAGLDVFEEEPKVHPGLIDLPNVVLAPHIASASHETRLQMATLAVENCLAVLEGKTPPTPVNPEALQLR
jgi:glyoxylate reductase